jgi:thiamine-monophosphate kinase
MDELIMSTLLSDLGERFIIRNILPHYVQGVGDDCAVLSVTSDDIVVTIDPVPDPAARVIGNDDDPFWMGWLLVTINVSDLAAAGAVPIGFLSALELPASTPKATLERLLDGVSAACSANRIPYLGGNLKEAGRISATGVAFGRCELGRAIKRTGASKNAAVVSIGGGGIFWRDALQLLRGANNIDKDVSPVFRPSTQIVPMVELSKEGLIEAAMDNSDGLLPSLYELAYKNGMQIIIDMERLEAPTETPAGIEGERLWLGWGDWNVIAAVHHDGLERVKVLCRQFGSNCTEIGRFVVGEPEVFLQRNDRVIKAPRLESERFVSDSWFSSGIGGYVETLLSIPLP